MRKLTKDEISSLQICAAQLATAYHSHCVSLLRPEQQEVIAAINNALFDDDKARVGDPCIQCWARWTERIAKIYYEQTQCHQSTSRKR